MFASNVNSDEALGTDEIEVLTLPDSSESEEEEYNEVDVANDDEIENEHLTQLTKAAAAARATDFDVARSDVDSEEEDELEGWGTARKDYYGADEVDTEQAALDEETEAKRIQAKQLQAMTDADYGFDDEDWAPENNRSQTEQYRIEQVTEAIPEVILPEDATTDDIKAAMIQRYPEFSALSKEFLAWQPELQRLWSLVVEQKVVDATIISKYWALTAYVTSLAMYFAILTETASEDSGALAKSPVELRDHDVMKAIVKSRSAWMKLKNVEEPELQSDDDTAIHAHTNGNGLNSATNGTDGTFVKAKKSKKSKLDKEKKKSKVTSSEERRAARRAAVEDDLAQLTELTKASTSSHSLPTRLHATADLEFGDETEMTAHEATEKAKRRKTLRFYTSQIAQKTQKRGAASRDTGGDMDIPRREKWRDRQIRLAEEAEEKQKRREAYNTADITEERGNVSDDYDDLVSKIKKSKEEKKAAKRDAYESGVASQQALFDEDGVGADDGKRKVNYQIEKNKGLAPYRKKENRNPRVKKRIKYESQKKKLSSIRAVYKGGPGKAGYQGELTGIKTGLVKSVKL